MYVILLEYILRDYRYNSAVLKEIYSIHIRLWLFISFD